MLKVDEEFKNLIPPLTFDERNGLRENLITNGCLDSIKIWNGFIIDGHNRYEICTEEGIEYRTDELSFESKEDVKIWMIRSQLDKRNVNDYMRTRLALKMEDIFEEKAKKQHALKHTEQYKEFVKGQNSAPLPEFNTVKTREEVAKVAGVSRDTVAKVKFIEENATEEQKKDLEQDKTSIHKVFTELKKKETPKENLQDLSEFAPDEVVYEKDLEEKIHRDLDGNIRTFEELIGTDVCMNSMMDRRIPDKSELYMCPCCEYGFHIRSITWYNPDAMDKPVKQEELK